MISVFSSEFHSIPFKMALDVSNMVIDFNGKIFLDAFLDRFRRDPSNHSIKRFVLHVFDGLFVLCSLFLHLLDVFLADLFLFLFYLVMQNLGQFICFVFRDTDMIS